MPAHKEHASQWKPFGLRRTTPPHGPRTPAEELRTRFGDRAAPPRRGVEGEA